MAQSAKAVAQSAKAGAPGECHLQALQNNRLEVEDLGVEVDRAEGARGDDDALELGKDWFHCQAGIQATELQAKMVHQGGIWLSVHRRLLQAKWCIRVEYGFNCRRRLQGWCNTVQNLANTGFTARLASRQLSCRPNGASLYTADAANTNHAKL